ncbi:MAG: M50 family metallopeptidase [Chloroflexi bacterium]|nr:M50 family metallopeptidase [Chloroflexota bacterium]MCY4247023.1 M50 family metallopeptidase [Chloroflexota bacterium]
MLRTFVERKVRRQIVQRSLIISTLGFAAIVALWNTPALAGLAHPLRMFINNIHGGLTAFAMQVSGGTVASFTLSEAGAYTLLFQDGAEALIMSAGYLGSALLGALLFYLVNRAPHLLRGLSLVLGVFTIGFLALFIRPDAAGDWLSLLVCLGFGALLIFLGATGAGDINQLRSRKSITQIVLSIIALTTTLHIVLDLPAVLTTPATSGDTITNPVAYFAKYVMPGASVEAVAYSWSAIAIALLGAAFHLAIVRPLRQIPKNEDIV